MQWKHSCALFKIPVRPAWHTQSYLVPRAAKPRGICYGPGLAKACVLLVTILSSPATILQLSYSQPLPDPSNRGSMLSQPLDQPQEESGQGYRVVLDTPCIAGWATDKYQKGESGTFHTNGIRYQMDISHCPLLLIIKTVVHLSSCYLPNVC